LTREAFSVHITFPQNNLRKFNCHSFLTPFSAQKWTREKEGDAVLYDIELTQEGRKFEADIGEDGKILEDSGAKK